MKKNQRRLGILLSYVGQGLHILIVLFYTPVMLRILGQSEYGLYQLVYATVSYLSLFGLGFNASYMRFYSREKANNDDECIAKLNGMFMTVFVVLGIICLVCGLVMVLKIETVFGAGFTPDEYRKARVLMWFLIVNLVLTFPNSVFSCIITSQERFIFLKLMIILQMLLNPLITMPVLLLGYGSVGMVVVTTFITVAMLITNWFYSVRMLKARFRFNGMEFGQLKEMWVFTFYIFLNLIVDRINWSVDKYLLGRIMGTVAVAIYSVGGQINSLYSQLSGSVSNVFVPQVNRIVAETNDNNELSKIFIKVGRVQFLIMMLFVSGFVIYGKPFITYWAGTEYTESYYVTLLLIIPVTIPLIQNLGIEIQRAKNKHKVRSIVYLVISIANVFISIFLIKKIGTIGAPLGTAISIFVGNGLFMNWYYYKYLDIDIPAFWRNIMDFVPGVIISGVFGFVSRVALDYTSVGKLVISMALYCIVYCLAMYFTGMNDKEKEWVMVPIKLINFR